MSDARVLGVVERGPEGVRLAYAAGHVPVTAELLEAAGEVPPTLVYRFAAPCAAERCTHYDGSQCRLAQRIVAGLDPSVDRLPACAIRPSCRWYAEQGAGACHRCPSVVTRMEEADPALMEIAGLPA